MRCCDICVTVLLINNLGIRYINRRGTSYGQMMRMERKRRSPWLLMLRVLGLLLLVVSQADSSPADKTIRIGYLLEHKPRAGAINVAIEQAQSDGLLREYNFRYVRLLPMRQKFERCFNFSAQTLRSNPITFVYPGMSTQERKHSLHEDAAE